MLAATALLWALPAVTANAALERAQFEAALMTARDYADDRSLVFYCLRRVREQVPFLYAGLQTDLEQTVVKMKVAGASARQTAEVVQAVLSQVRFYGRDARDESLERRCIAKDVERSRAEARGVIGAKSARQPCALRGKTAWGRPRGMLEIRQRQRPVCPAVRLRGRVFLFCPSGAPELRRLKATRSRAAGSGFGDGLQAESC